MVYLHYEKCCQHIGYRPGQSTQTPCHLCGGGNSDRVQPITREGQARVISSAFASQIFQILKFEKSDEEDQKQNQKNFLK